MAADIDDVRTFAGSKAYHHLCESHGGGTPLNLTASCQRFDIILDDWPSVAGKPLGTSDSETDRIGIFFYMGAGNSYNSAPFNSCQQSGFFDIARISLREDPLGLVPFLTDLFRFDYSAEAELLECQTLLQVFTNEII